MATILPPPEAAILPRKERFSRARLFFLAALFLVLVFCITFSWNTRDAMTHLPFLHGQNKAHTPSGGRRTIVDLSTWQTAEALAPLAESAEEVGFAHEAERLADHAIDQAFAAALRQPSAQHRALTGDALALSQKVAQLEQVVKDDQAQVKSLATVGNSPHAPAGDSDDLDILKAQMGLDSDVLTDAQQQLAQASGDERSRIQQELAAHEALMAKYDGKSHNDGGEGAIVAAQHNSTLAQRTMSWMAQSSRYQLIQQSMQQAQADAATITTEYAAVKSQVDKTGQDASPADAHSISVIAIDRAARLASLQEKAEQRQLEVVDNDRIQTQTQLAAIYGKWSAQLLLQHRILLHLILESIALIAFILICVVLSNGLVRHWLSRPTLDQRRARTLQTMLELAVQFIGVLLILLVIFGVPKQIPTILGLATAGLTVALQDFILAFFGWFVLVGKNGIRLGDSVEINGVAGEVTEIGLFRTTMLETGNSADKGHPTGRRVAFLNKYAINGQYFNFSTVGQWMWDEISVSIPESDDTYEMVELIHKAVLKETDSDAQQAEQEWKRTSKTHGLSQFGAGAQINMRPASSGVNILIRYVTRAATRFEMRNRLYQTVIDVLHKPASHAPPEPAKN